MWGTSRAVADRCVIGYVHPGTVRAEFCASLLAVCMEGSTDVEAVLAVGSGPNISTARNIVARSFLEKQTAPWLLMCDTDMTFPADMVDRLIAAADPVQRPVVGALCFTQNTDDPAKGPYSTMYELTEKDGDLAFVRYTKWPENTVVRVAATGAACLLIHRTVLERVGKASGDRAAPWFRESVAGAALIGEDLTFCLRCAAAGIPVHVHTGARAGHIKAQMI
jgi:GT2 family glycosyltransferase